MYAKILDITNIRLPEAATRPLLIISFLRSQLYLAMYGG